MVYELGFQLPVHYLVSNYGITSSLQHQAHNIRFPTTDLLPVYNHALTSGSQSTDYNFRYSITSFKYYISTQHLPFIKTFFEPKFNMTTNPWVEIKCILWFFHVLYLTILNFHQPFIPCKTFKVYPRPVFSAVYLVYLVCPTSTDQSRDFVWQELITCN